VVRMNWLIWLSSSLTVSSNMQLYCIKYIYAVNTHKLRDTEMYPLIYRKGKNDRLINPFTYTVLIPCTRNTLFNLGS
jgi:hypothetical protein